MRLPIIPAVVAAVLLGVVVYLFNSTQPGRRVIDVPKLTRLADIPGIETEVAVAPDGNRHAIVASGDIWLVDNATGQQKQLTQTADAEFFPSWLPDGKQITFTRRGDTFAINPETAAEELFRSNAAWLSTSSSGATAFVRDRALWLVKPNDPNELQLVEADAVPDITIQTPRFSPDSLQLAFIKSQLGLRGEVWLVDIANGMARPLVADRAAENAVDVGWINEGRNLAYLTDRAGAFSLWHVDIAEAAILPLTTPLVTVPLARVGIGVSGDRIVVSRHLVDSSIVISDGTAVANTERLEFEPAVSPDGRIVAYTIAEQNRFEIWTAGIQGNNSTFRTLGREPRFGPNNYELVYSHIDLSGNADIWRLDIRNGLAERMTDADEIDLASDWSPNGQAITFASARNGPVSISAIPGSGGKRRSVTERGHAPRFSPDSRTILFWNMGAAWTVDLEGGNMRQVYDGLPMPVPGAWSKKGPAFVINGEVRTPTEKLFGITDRPVWPQFDVLRDGRLVVAPIDIRDTALWAIDLTYKENQ